MSAFRSTAERTVARVRTHPWLLLGSLPLVAILTLPILLTIYVDSIQVGPVLFFGWCVAAWLVVAPATTAAVGYATATTVGKVRPAPRELAIGFRRYPRQLVRTLAIRLVAIPFFVVALGLVGGVGLATLTGVQAVGYALDWWTLSRVQLVLLALLFVLLASVVAGALFLFTNSGALRERSLRTAAVTSARAFAARPLSALGTAVVEVLLSLAPFVIAPVVVLATEQAVGEVSDIGFRVLAVAFVATGVPLLGLRAVFHELASRRMTDAGTTARPFVARLRATGVTRLLLTGLLVGGVVFGGVAVRTADERPGSQFATSPDPVPTDGDVDANALVNRSFDRVKATSHVSRNERYNRSTGRVDYLTVRRVEYPDGGFEFYSLRRDHEDARNWKVTGGYISSTTIAPFRYSEVTTDGRPPNVTTLRRDRTPLVNAVNHYPVSPVRPGRVYDQPFSRLADGNWHVVSRSGDRVVLGVTDYSAVARRDPERVENGSVRVVLDADAGYITRIEERWTFTERGSDETESYRGVMTFRRYETNTVTRPPALGPQTPLQALADALYY